MCTAGVVRSPCGSHVDVPEAALKNLNCLTPFLANRYRSHGEGNAAEELVVRSGCGPVVAMCVQICLWWHWWMHQRPSVRWLLRRRVRG